MNDQLMAVLLTASASKHQLGEVRSDFLKNTRTHPYAHREALSSLLIHKKARKLVSHKAKAPTGADSVALVQVQRQ